MCFNTIEMQNNIFSYPQEGNYSDDELEIEIINAEALQKSIKLRAQLYS